MNEAVKDRDRTPIKKLNFLVPAPMKAVREPLVLFHIPNHVDHRSCNVEDLEHKHLILVVVEVEEQSEQLEHD
jgi:hypothetical protein